MAWSASCFAGEPGWRLLPPLAMPRVGHTAVMVHTGEVILVGGRDATGSVITSSVVLDGITGNTAPTGNTDPSPRTNSAVVVVPGTANTSVVYVIGGYTGGSGSYASSAAVSRLRYDATMQEWRWESVGSLPIATGDCRAVFDGVDEIIVSGGRTQTTGAIGSGTRSTVTASINIITGVIRRLGDHITARAEHGLYRFADQSNTTVVMAAGGEPSPPTSTELLAGTSWDPRANAPLAYRVWAVPVSDVSATARTFGGEQNNVPLATCEWYDPKSGWRNAPRMNEARSHFDATVIASPTDTALAYLAVAGKGATASLNSCEIFSLPTSSDPAGGWVTFHALNVAAADRTVALTASNVPVVCGGEGTDAVEVLQPLSAANVTFPSTEVGARSDSVLITITNTWLLPIRIRNISVVGGADFIVTADTSVIELAAGQSRSLLAWFRPSQPGMRTSQLVLNMGIVSDTVLLQGNGLASTVQVITDVMDHGDVPVKTANRICLPLLRNNGTDTTWVDSIVIDPPGAFVVESPVGKTAVAPGEELTVCIVFRPQQRGAVAGSATMYIGPRSYPVAVLGNGIRTLGVIRNGVCDTISAQRNDVVTLSAAFEIVGDRDVTVTDVQVQTAIPGTAVLAVPSLVPFTLRPQEIRIVDVEYTVQREGEEHIQLTATSNSDSLMSGVVCVVIRSRNVVPNVTAVQVGDLCIGDTVATSIVITNASAVEDISVTDVAVENSSQISVSTQGAFVLPPRSSQVITVVVGASQSGPLNGNIVVNTSTGSSTIPVVGHVLDGLMLQLPSASMAPGMIVRLPVGISAPGTQQATFLLHHAEDVLAITGIETIPGQAELSTAATTQRVVGGTRLVLDFVQPLSAPTTVHLVVEALRGSNVVTDLFAKRDAMEACVLGDTSAIYIDPSCGQERSLVSLGQGANVSVSPLPASTIMNVHVSSVGRNNLELRLVDVSGQLVLSQAVHAGYLNVDVSAIPTGTYSLQLLSSVGFEDAVLLAIQH